MLHYLFFKHAMIIAIGSLFFHMNCFSQNTMEGSDLSVLIYSKNVWHMTWVFVEKDDAGQYNVVGEYGVHSQRNQDGVFVKMESNMLGKITDAQGMKHSYSRSELAQMSKTDKTFSAIMKRIDNDFFELTNKEKLSCFEKYCERQN